MVTLLIQSRPMMAEIVGVTVSGLQKMEQRGFPVHLKQGAGTVYHLPSVIKWLKADWERQWKQVKPDDPTSSLDVRRKTADARKAEIEVARLEGSLLDYELIRHGLDGVMINMRTILLSLSSQIGRDIDDPAMRVRVVALTDRCVCEALELLANYDPVVDPHSARASEDDARDEPASHPPAAQNDHQPVGRKKPLSQSRRRRQRAVAQ